MYTTKKINFKAAIEDTSMCELVDELINRMRLSNGLEFCTTEQIDCLQSMLAGMVDDIGIAWS